MEENIDRWIVMFTGPIVGEHDYMLNINVAGKQIPIGSTLEDFCKRGEQQQKKEFPDYVKVQEYSTTIGQLPAVVQIFTATVRGFPIKDKQAIVIKGRVAYIITYDVTTDCHDEYLDCFECVINSFKFD